MAISEIHDLQIKKYNDNNNPTSPLGDKCLTYNRLAFPKSPLGEVFSPLLAPAGHLINMIKSQGPQLSGRVSILYKSGEPFSAKILLPLNQRGYRISRFQINLVLRSEISNQLEITPPGTGPNYLAERVVWDGAICPSLLFIIAFLLCVVQVVATLAVLNMC